MRAPAPVVAAAPARSRSIQSRTLGHRDAASSSSSRDRALGLLVVIQSDRVIGVWRGGAPRDRGGTVGATGLTRWWRRRPAHGLVPSKRVCHGARGHRCCPSIDSWNGLLQPIPPLWQHPPTPQTA